MNAPDGRRGYPKPPPHIWAQLEDAGRDGDTTRLNLAHAVYVAWLADVHGIYGIHGNDTPEEAYR